MNRVQKTKKTKEEYSGLSIPLTNEFTLKCDRLNWIVYKKGQNDPFGYYGTLEGALHDVFIDSIKRSGSKTIDTLVEACSRASTGIHRSVDAIDKWGLND